jgi:MtfA peptidase
LFLLMNLFLTRKYRKRKKILLTPFPDGWENILINKVRYYAQLNEYDRYVFKKKVQVFLAEVKITGIGFNSKNEVTRAPVDDETEILIASAAVIPVFKIPDWEYDRLDEVIVYPGSFDEDFHISGGKRDILGMVTGRTSAVIISGKALADGFREKNGQNVALHEFIHKIDEEDGEIDGIPAFFLSRSELEYWKKTVEDEMDQIAKGRSDIDSYALKDRSEFFAVAGEYFFEKPQRMKENHPALYRLMCRMFRQDLAAAIYSEAAGSLGIRALNMRKGQAQE